MTNPLKSVCFGTTTEILDTTCPPEPQPKKKNRNLRLFRLGGSSTYSSWLNENEMMKKYRADVKEAEMHFGCQSINTRGLEHALNESRKELQQKYMESVVQHYQDLVRVRTTLQVHLDIPEELKAFAEGMSTGTREDARRVGKRDAVVAGRIHRDTSSVVAKSLRKRGSSQGIRRTFTAPGLRRSVAAKSA